MRRNENRSFGYAFVKNRVVLASLLGAMASLLCSCANPINARTAQNYYQLGVQAEQGGDFTLARRNFSRAYGNAQMGNLGLAAEASYLYEYARVTGYVGNYDESEKAFGEVLALIEKAQGEADRLLAPTLTEYSRLLHDTEQHQKAVSVFERAVAALEKAQIESSDPLAYAAFLDEYASSLKAVGLGERAAVVGVRSAALKAKHADETPHFTPTRYRKA